MVQVATDGQPGAPTVDVIVVAAGGSTRMNGIDKRLALVGGRPLLLSTLEAVAAASIVERIVLVMGAGSALDALRDQMPGKVEVIVAGGPHRGASVEAGFRALEDIHGGQIDPERVVLVHDAARPLVPIALIDAVATAASSHGASVPLVPVADTVRNVRDGVIGEIVDRTDLMGAQTPQAARAGLLSRAFQAFPSSGTERFTDEAALLMACTIRVHPVPGDPVNFKVTLPADLERADAMLSARTSRRVGSGFDSHPFGPGEPLRLGGIEIPGAPRLYGHSDGDVALHAIADALLGAAALGDLGRLFPADDRTPRGVDSSRLLDAVLVRLAGAGWEVEAIDLTITGSRPRLAEHLDDMQAAVAALLGLDIGAVGVKASTGNLDGATGAGRAMSATATASIRSRSAWQSGEPPVASDTLRARIT